MSMRWSVAEENNTAVNDRRWIWVASLVAEALPATNNQRFWSTTSALRDQPSIAAWSPPACF